MTLSDYWNSRLPEYYDTMYRDGYTPQEVWQAFRNTLYKELQQRQEQEQLEKEIQEAVNRAFENALKDLMK